MKKKIKQLLGFGLVVLFGLGSYFFFFRPDRTAHDHKPSIASPDGVPQHAQPGKLPFDGARTHSITTNQPAVATGLSNASVSQTSNLLLLAALGSTVPSEQREAVAALFHRKRSLSDQELLGFWSRLRTITADTTLDPQFRADTIWALAGIGMLAKERGILTSQEVEGQCIFLVEIAGQESTNLSVRRVALKAIGDLRLANGIPILTTLLANPINWNTPELTRPASIALSTLAPTQAIRLIAPILSATTNSAVADTAAYALGGTADPAALSVLVSNRSRLGNNLSVDNAIQALCTNVFATLADHLSPYLTDAIYATKALWKPEQQEQYVPLLMQVLQASDAEIAAKQVALTRLLDHASTLPFAEEKRLLMQIAPLVQEGSLLGESAPDIERRLGATILKPVAIEPRIQDE